MTKTTEQVLAELAAATARFEALAHQSTENAKAFIQGLKDDRKELENMKKVLA